MRSVFAIAIKRTPRDADDLRHNMMDIAKGPVPLAELKARMLAMVPEVAWNDDLNRAVGRFTDCRVEIKLQPEHGVVTITSNQMFGKVLEITLRFFERPHEWILFDEEMERWRPPVPPPAAS